MAQSNRQAYIAEATSTMMSVKLPAIAVRQGRRVFYLTSAHLETVIEISQVPRFNPEDDSGYQRMPTDSRIKAAGKYMAEKSGRIFPGSILLGGKGFKYVESKNGLGYIELEDGAKFNIVDGQTRILGMKHALDEGSGRLKDYQIPITLVKFQREIDEMLEFRTINRQAKRVDTGLTDRLIVKQVSDAMMNELDIEKSLFETKVTYEIVDRLNKSSSSPWKGKIKPPNTKKGTGTISERSMATSLEKARKEMTKNMVDKRQQSNAILQFWSQAAKICTQSQKKPKDFRYFWNTTGAYIVNELFARMYRNTGDLNCHTNLEKIKLFNDSLFAVNGKLKGIGGKAGFNKVVDDLMSEL